MLAVSAARPAAAKAATLPAILAPIAPIMETVFAAAPSRTMAVMMPVAAARAVIKLQYGRRHIRRT
jgi:hypothetical protein